MDKRIMILHFLHKFINEFGAGSEPGAIPFMPIGVSSEQPYNWSMSDLCSRKGAFPRLNYLIWSNVYVAFSKVHVAA